MTKKLHASAFDRCKDLVGRGVVGRSEEPGCERACVNREGAESGDDFRFRLVRVLPAKDR